MVTGCYREIHTYIYIFASVLGFTFERLTKFYKVRLIFYLTNNNCVNAKFLSRFIAKKLRQNYPLKELLNPIRKELLYVMKITGCPRKSYVIKTQKKYLNCEFNKSYRRVMFKVLIKNLFFCYIEQYWNFFI